MNILTRFGVTNMGISDRMVYGTLPEDICNLHISIGMTTKGAKVVTPKLAIVCKNQHETIPSNNKAVVIGLEKSI